MAASLRAAAPGGLAARAQVLSARRGVEARHARRLAVPRGAGQQLAIREHGAEQAAPGVRLWRRSLGGCAELGGGLAAAAHGHRERGTRQTSGQWRRGSSGSLRRCALRRTLRVHAPWRGRAGFEAVPAERKLAHRGLASEGPPPRQDSGEMRGRNKRHTALFECR
jgi:hypothetical protein